MSEVKGTARTSDVLATELKKLVASVGSVINGRQMQQALSH